MLSRCSRSYKGAICCCCGRRRLSVLFMLSIPTTSMCSQLQHADFSVQIFGRNNMEALEIVQQPPAKQSHDVRLAGLLIHSNFRKSLYAC